MGITDAPQEWFNVPDEYKQYRLVMQTETDYLTFRLDRPMFENTALKQQLETLYALVQPATDKGLLEALFWKRALEETRKSLSFRLGRALTWLPRKIRDIKKY